MSSRVSPEAWKVLGDASDPRFSKGALPLVAEGIERRPDLAFAAALASSPLSRGPFRQSAIDSFNSLRNQYELDLARGRAQDTLGADYLTRLRDRFGAG